MFKDSNNFKVKVKSFSLFTFAVIILPLLGFFSIYYILFEMGLWDRISYFYKKWNFNIITLLLSSRDLNVTEAIKIFEDYSFLEKILGTGHEWMRNMSHGSITEIDLSDFIMMYGVIGAFFAYSFYISRLVYTIKHKDNNVYSSYIILLLIFLIAISLTAGHTMYSGMAGPLMAVVLAFSQYKDSTFQLGQSKIFLKESGNN
jgi:hypothetical protein